jgi:UDP-arabinose 4-epimerase
MGNNRSAVLVTGGAGNIGSHTCKGRARAGYLPVSYGNLVYGHEWAVRWGPLERGDLLDSARLDDVIARHMPVAAIHFAAYAYVGESVADPGKYYRNNVGGTISMLEALRRGGIGHLVFSSTCATFGVPQLVPIDEGHPQRPVNPYGRTKLMIEQVLRDYDHVYGLRSMSLRYFNAAGADPEAQLGEDHTPETHLVPLVLRAALDPAQPVSIHGTDYPTPVGTCIRDYVHVTDLADAHVRALNLLRQGAGTAVCNLGTGHGHSVREVIAAAGRVTGREIAFVEGPRRPGDPPELVADASLARVTLGWSASFSMIDAMIETAWRWHEKARREPRQPALASAH